MYLGYVEDGTGVRLDHLAELKVNILSRENQVQFMFHWRVWFTTSRSGSALFPLRRYFERLD